MIEPTPNVKVEPLTTPAITIVAFALENVLSDIWHEQNKHKYIGDHPEEFRNFCESVLYSALSKKNTNAR